MKYGKNILTVVFAVLMLTGGLALEGSAQRRGRVIVRPTTRPIIVRRYIYRDPFWYDRYYGSGFYDPYLYDPYYRARQQRYYLERELAGNRRELAEHQRKYRADGLITAKEQRELDDDYRDVANAAARLRRYRAY